MEYKLLYHNAAKRFSEALPLGNGSLGAMVYGDFPHFHYSLNIDTLWSGKPNVNDHVPVSEEELKTTRELIKKGQYYEAEKHVQDVMIGQKYNESYVSAGFLNLQFQDQEEFTDITRELAFDTAVAATVIHTKQGKIKIESFVSCADDVLITYVTSDCRVTVDVSADSLLKHCISVENQILELRGEAPEHVEPHYTDSEEPIVYGEGMRYVILTGSAGNGAISENGAGIRISGATEFLLCTAIHTGFCGWDQPMEYDTKRLRECCMEKINGALQYTYQELYDRHWGIYNGVFDRVSLDLNASRQHDLPIGERLERLKNGEQDNGLYELLFQYGRYMMICSSRPDAKDTQPANLQGIWCEDIRPMWSCNWTININTEMNYWLTGPCALTECDLPLIKMVQEISDSGRSTAEETCKSRGWAVCHNLDLWRQTTPVKGNVKWSYWPMGGVWLATHLYQHFLFTNDREFLKEEAYPVLSGAARFCLDWLYEDDGILHSSPSTSPENTFLDAEGNECAVSDSSTMDIALIREILMNTLDAASVLGTDQELSAEIENALAKLPEFKVGKFGQLQEWSQDFREFDPNHRHFAHLVGFHPFHQIDHDTRPEFLDSVEQVLNRRLEGMRHYIGWDEAWLVNFYSRLRNGDEAERHLSLFLKHCAYENLFSLHPPLSESIGEREIFQIDGNFGITAGIAEMLMFTKPGAVMLLPALPKVWETGQVKGLCAHGGHVINISWEKGKLEHAAVYGKSASTILLRYAEPFSVTEEDGKTIKAQNRQDIWEVKLDVEKNKTYQVRRG